MNRLKSFFAVAGALFLGACSQPHLDIFPELEDPALMAEKLPADALREDVDALYNGVVLRHPDISSYADMEKLGSAVESLKSSLDKPMTRLEFYTRVGELTHLFNDGHTLLLWPYPEIQAFEQNGGSLFPFTVFIDENDRIFLNQSFESADGRKLHQGMEILSINGNNNIYWVNHLQRYASGESELLRKQLIARRLSTYLWATSGIADEADLEIHVDGQDQALHITPQDQWHLADQ